MAFVSRLVTADVNFLGIDELGLLTLDVGRQVYQDRPRAACRSDMKGLFYDPREVINIFDQIVVFCYRPSYSCNIGFLERVVTD